MSNIDITRRKALRKDVAALEKTKRKAAPG